MSEDHGMPQGPLKPAHGDDRTPADAEFGVVEMHAPIFRELAEPRDGYEPIQVWWVFAVMALLGWGGWYLGTYSGDFRPDVYDERPGAAAAVAAPVTALVDPLVLGKRVYTNCMSCHQADGRGVQGNYPPLAGSEWVRGDDATLARILLHGLQGEVTVSGLRFNQVMPAWGRFKDEQIAAVLTFIRASWGNGAAAVEPATIASVRAATTARRQPWTMAELRQAGEASAPGRAAAAAR